MGGGDINEAHIDQYDHDRGCSVVRELELGRNVVG